MKVMSLVGIVLIVFGIDCQAEVLFSHSTNVDDKLAQMSLEEKVGQLFLIGVNGTELNQINKQKIQKLKPGGVIFFGRNIKTAKQVSDFLHDLQLEAEKNNLPPMFTAVDQEGGSVSRLKHWPPLPSAAAVGRAGDTDSAYKLALFSGQVLRTLGFNTNLAPVLDLADPYKKSFIGSRSFGSDPKQAYQFGSAVALGYRAAGVLAVAKHFPGHGDSQLDSHKELPVVNQTLSELREKDLFPFESLVQGDLLHGVMVAHLSFPNVDTSGAAVTYSRVFLNSYLRKTMDYKGLVFTDDLEMLGAKSIQDPAERALKATLAGADVIMVAWNPDSQEKAIKGLIKAVTENKLPESILNATVRRILTAKTMYGMFHDTKKPTREDLENAIHHRELLSTIDSVVKKNLTLSQPESLFSDLSKKRETVLASTSLTFSNNFTNKIRNIKKITLRKDFKKEDVSQILSQHHNQHNFIFYIDSVYGLKQMSKLTDKQKAKIFLVTSELPAYLRGSGEFKGVFYSYTKHPLLGTLLNEVMYSRRPASKNQK